MNSSQKPELCLSAIASVLYRYTYADRTHYLFVSSVYITGAPKGHTVVAAPETGERVATSG